MEKIRLYDGAVMCEECKKKCPVVDYDASTDMVKVYDPDKPESGSFVMSAQEYNALLANAKPVSKN